MIRYADEMMREDIVRLWHDCFGDSNAYVDFFLQHYDIARHMLVFIDGEKPVSMLSMLPMSLVTQTGTLLSGRYIYAVATDPRYRGRGLSSKLLAAAHEKLAAAGVHLSVLVPARGDLFDFYRKRGYEPAFFIGDASISAESIPRFEGSFSVAEADAAEFSRIRERAFSGSTMFVRWDGDALAYRLAETAMLGGETLLLQAVNAQAIAVCRNEGDTVWVKELALDGMTVAAALSILQHKYPAKEYRLRLPMDTPCPYPLTRTPHAMAYWYDKRMAEMVRQSQGNEPYMNLVLD